MRLFHQSYGKQQSGKPPLIILHGLFGSHDNWHTIGKRFGEMISTYGLDLRNHGRSPHSESMSYREMAGDVLEFMDDQQIDSAILLGHSLGGKVSMQVAFDTPDRLAKLIVIDIAPKAYPPHHDGIIHALLSLDLAGFATRKDADDALAKSISSLPVRQFLLKNLSRSGTGSFRWKMNLDVISKKYEEINSELILNGTFEKPTLFVKGANSSYLSESDGPMIRKFFPRMELVTLQTGHWVHAEAPDQLELLVLSFLNNNGKNANAGSLPTSISDSAFGRRVRNRS